MKSTFSTQEIIAKRALCLGALVIRAEFEQVIQSISESEIRQIHEKMIADLNKWLYNERLAEFQSNKEKQLFSKPVGNWRQQDLINAMWRKESLGVILWSLSLFNSIPSYDKGFDQKSVIDKIGPMKSTGDFFEKVKLRSKEEIEKARDIAELWHWRSRTTQIIRDGEKPPDGFTFEQIIKLSANKAYESDYILKPIEDDFPAFGKAYKKISDEEYSVTTSIAMERHFALNWLCGHSENWDETSTDT